jgi:hypothetical protein
MFGCLTSSAQALALRDEPGSVKEDTPAARS